MKDISIPTILAIAILLVGIVDGVIYTKNQQIFKVKASFLLRPTNVRVSNIEDASFTVSWTTDKKAVGFVHWGQKETNINKFSMDTNPESSNIHYVDIKDLSPNTSYFFKINSGGEEFDNNGSNWQVHTGKSISDQKEANIMSGRILTARGQPAVRAVVYGVVGGSSPISTITTNEGLWTLNIAKARTLSLDRLITIDERTTPIEIQVHADPDGIALASMYPISAKPAPPIIIGKTQNFKNALPEDIDYVPEAQIDFP